MKLWTVVIVMLCCAVAWGQTFTANATNASYNVHFTGSSGSTAAPTMPDQACSCSHTIWDELGTSSFGFLGGGSVTGACSQTIGNSFDFTVNPIDDFNWETGESETISCPGLPPQTNWLAKKIWQRFRTANVHTIWDQKPGTGCAWIPNLQGQPVQWCSYGTPYFCTAATTPPTWQPTSTFQIVPSTAQYNGVAACYDTGTAWSCHGAQFKDYTKTLYAGDCTILPAP